MSSDGVKFGTREFPRLQVGVAVDAIVPAAPGPAKLEEHADLPVVAFEPTGREIKYVEGQAEDAVIRAMVDQLGSRLFLSSSISR